MLDLNRRDFIRLLGGAAVVWPLVARAQQPGMPVIGLLSSRSPAVDAPLIAIMRQGLKETGLIEGQNVTLDYRWAEGQYDRLAGLAADLVRQQVAVIATTGGDASALAAKATTATIPIIFMTGSDPIRRRRFGQSGFWVRSPRPQTSTSLTPSVKGCATTVM